MRRVLTAAALAAMALVAAAPAANATDYCNGNGDVVRVGGAGTYAAYVTVDHWYDLYIVWVYAESNGVPDLQRGGVSMLGDADICQDSANPDLLIF